MIKKGDKEQEEQAAKKREFYKKLFYGSFDFFIFISFSFDFGSRVARTGTTTMNKLKRAYFNQLRPPLASSLSLLIPPRSQSTQSSCSLSTFHVLAQLVGCFQSCSLSASRYYRSFEISRYCTRSATHLSADAGDALSELRVMKISTFFALKLQCELRSLPQSFFLLNQKKALHC